MIYYKKKKGRKAPFITVAILIVIILLSNRNPVTTVWSSRVLNTFLQPVNNFVYSSSVLFQQAVETVIGSKPNREDVARLTKENQALREELRQKDSIINREDFLRKEYELLKNTNYHLQSANIIAKEPSNLFTRFTVDKGSFDGVEVGDIILQGTLTKEGQSIEGLVGRVIEVGPNYSKVASVLDDSANISLRTIRSGDLCIVNERDGKRFYGYTLVPTADVKEGDELMTSGLGGLYPKDLYLGKVITAQLSEDELTKKVQVESPIDFFRLYRVLIMDREEGQYE